MPKPKQRSEFNFTGIFHVVREPECKTEVPIGTTNIVLQKNQQINKKIQARLHKTARCNSIAILCQSVSSTEALTTFEKVN